MAEIINIKPEPLPPKSNWHYDAYFLLQLEKLTNRKAIHKNPSLKLEKGTQINYEITSSALTTADSSRQQNEQQIRKRQDVMNRINDLADTIGVSVRII